MLEKKHNEEKKKGNNEKKKTEQRQKETDKGNIAGKKETKK